MRGVRLPDLLELALVLGAKWGASVVGAGLEPLRVILAPDVPADLERVAADAERLGAAASAEGEQFVRIEPGDGPLALPSRFAAAVEVLLAASGGYVSSGFRTRHRNRIVGGALRSQHTLGLAVDLVDVRDRERLDAAARALGLRAIGEPRHVHVQALDAAALVRRRR